MNADRNDVDFSRKAIFTGNDDDVPGRHRHLSAEGIEDPESESGQ